MSCKTYRAASWGKFAGLVSVLMLPGCATVHPDDYAARCLPPGTATGSTRPNLTREQRLAESRCLLGTKSPGYNIDSGGGDDLVTGGPLDDVIVGGPDNDRLDGGPGIDLAAFSGVRADYVIISQSRQSRRVRA